MPYLIDGHNLIPKLGLRLDSPDDELDLVGIIQEFSRLSRHEAQIYFDGAPAREARSQKFGTVTAHFIRIGSTADEAIRGRVKKLGHAARNWTVVSSDHEIQNAARLAHATVLSSEEFAQHLSRLRRSSKTATGERKLTEEEIRDWMNLFRRGK